MVDITKIEHYVPRFYLKNFAVKKQSKFLINCFDKSAGRNFLTDIRKIGAEKHFYDTDNQQIERSLANFESKCNIVYEKLIRSADLNSLTADDKTSFAYFVATQWLRTRERREGIRDFIKQLTERLSKENLSPEFETKLKEANTEPYQKSLHISQLKDLPIYVNIILRMKWALFINKTKIPYWTSDNPICMHNKLDLRPHGNLGLTSKGIEMRFPLNTQICLFMGDPDMYAILPTKYELTDEQNIIFANSLQTICSTRFVFSVEGDFALAEKIISENPELRNPDRKRSSVD